jgi:hypothetical protein
MPASRQASRSDASALAVIAMISSGSDPSWAVRIRRVASRPSMTGIWQSISTAS